MKREPGRPAKPKEEKYVVRAFRLPPGLLAELESIVPKGERSAIVQEGLRRELARLKKKREG